MAISQAHSQVNLYIFQKKKTNYQLTMIFVLLPNINAIQTIRLGKMSNLTSEDRGNVLGGRHILKCIDFIPGVNGNFTKPIHFSLTYIFSKIRYCSYVHKS